MANVFIPQPIDHGTLTGLADAADHLWAFLLDGTRAMTGDIDVGGNDIVNVALVDGVDVSAHGSRHAAAGADPLQLAADSRVLGRAVGAGAGAVQELTGAQVAAILDAASAYVRRDGTTPLTGPWNAGAFNVTFGANFTLSADTPIFTMGSGFGAGVVIFNKANGSDWAFDWRNENIRRWLYYFEDDEDLAQYRYSSVAAFVNAPLHFNATDALASTVTTLGDAAILFSYGSVTAIFGDGTGTPNIILDKDGTATDSGFDYRSDSVLRFRHGLDGSEDWGLHTFDASGVFVDTAFKVEKRTAAGGTVTVQADGTLAIAGGNVFASDPAALVTAGDGSGSAFGDVKGATNSDKGFRIYDGASNIRARWTANTKVVYLSLHDDGGTLTHQFLQAAATAGANDDAGDTYVRGSKGGSTSGNGGTLYLLGGETVAGLGGGVTIEGFDGVGTDQGGGNIILDPGDATGTGTAGAIALWGPIAWDAPINHTLSSGNNTDILPTGFAGCNVVRFTPDAGGSTIVSISTVGSTARSIWLLVNVSTSVSIVVQHDDGSTGTAGYRFDLANGANITVRPRGCLMIWRDGATQRWRALAV